ncbi:GIY-YIG nuclease family protein [[Clostridium] scindens]|nr:GIY-YIG nuclease family protein [[Clostridium] scindens]
MSYYLYKFLDNKNQVIYVGKTENIKNRMMTHFTSSGHLPEECYQSVAMAKSLNLPETDFRETAKGSYLFNKNAIELIQSNLKRK